MVERVLLERCHGRAPSQCAVGASVREVVSSTLLTLRAEEEDPVLLGPLRGPGIGVVVDEMVNRREAIRAARRVDLGPVVHQLEGVL